MALLTSYPRVLAPALPESPAMSRPSSQCSKIWNGLRLKVSPDTEQTLLLLREVICLVPINRKVYIFHVRELLYSEGRLPARATDTGTSSGGGTGLGSSSKRNTRDSYASDTNDGRAPAPAGNPRTGALDSGYDANRKKIFLFVNVKSAYVVHAQVDDPLPIQSTCIANASTKQMLAMLEV